MQVSRRRNRETVSQSFRDDAVRLPFWPKTTCIPIKPCGVTARFNRSALANLTSPRMLDHSHLHTLAPRLGHSLGGVRPPAITAHRSLYEKSPGKGGTQTVCRKGAAWKGSSDNMRNSRCVLACQRRAVFRSIPFGCGKCAQIHDNAPVPKVPRPLKLCVACPTPNHRFNDRAFGK